MDARRAIGPETPLARNGSPARALKKSSMAQSWYVLATSTIFTRIYHQSLVLSCLKSKAMTASMASTQEEDGIFLLNTYFSMIKCSGKPKTTAALFSID